MSSQTQHPHEALICPILQRYISLNPALLSVDVKPPHNADLHTIYQFPNDTWVENLAVRSNGKILVTLISAPEVWEVDPFSDPATAELVYTFPDAISLLGIAEYAPDVFGVVVGNWSYKTFKYQPGSWSVWSLDMNDDDNWDYHGKATAHKISDIKSAKYLNGMTVLPANPTTVLVADCAAGDVYRLDTTTGAHSVAIDVPAMHPNTSEPISLGVNGVHFAPGEDDMLYFTNSLKLPSFSRVPVDPMDGGQTGHAETVVSSLPEFVDAADDFTIDDEGNAWIAVDAYSGLVKADINDGAAEVVLGASHKKIYGLTACQLGKAREDVVKGRLYITNNGGIAVPPPSGVVGGGVYAIDTVGL